MNVRPADGHEISATAMKQDYDFANNGSSGVSARFADEVKTGTYTLGYRFQRPDVPLVDFNVKVYDTTTNNTQTFLRDSPSKVFSALGASSARRRISTSIRKASMPTTLRGST